MSNEELNFNKYHEEKLKKKMTIDINKIQNIAQKYGKFDLSNYFQTTSRKFAIYLIDNNNKEITLQDGFTNKELEEKCKEGLFLQGRRSWALYGERKIANLNNPVDVIMIDKELLEDPDNTLFELLVFHEVCHLLEKREYYKVLNLTLTEHQLNVGKILSSLADNIYDRCGIYGKDEDHNALFGGILFHFLEQYDKIRCCELLSQSMIKNLFEDHTNDFKKV